MGCGLRRYNVFIVAFAPHRRFARRSTLIGLTYVSIVLAGLATVTPSVANATLNASYPVGVVKPSEPSGLAPPGVRSLHGYRLSYVQDFSGSAIPRGWSLFSGIPGGDPSGRFSPRHVQVAQGLLRLKVYRDPAFANRWVTGGLCQCQRPMTYGAYFVRSRVTGAGPNTAELLWPENNVWPPEVDFSEDLSHLNLTSATVHWGRYTDFQTLKINMTQWHTWGVIWTRSSILFIVDGHRWHQFTTVRGIPHIPMSLDFEQRTTCPSILRCPTTSSALLIDWVAEYQVAH